MELQYSTRDLARAAVIAAAKNRVLPAPTEPKAGS